jgi:hypothetical protein
LVHERVVRDFELLGSVEMSALLQRAAAAPTGEPEQFKTSNCFDSTAKHPEFLE